MLTKKTTILFPEELHERLCQLAKNRGVSLGYLVRNACISQYQLKSRSEKLEALTQLGSMDLPVGTPDEMKKESIPDPEPLPS